LDTATGQRITDLLFDLNRSSQSTLVLVTHDRSLAKRCGRVLELDAGHTVNGAATGGQGAGDQATSGGAVN
jgi:putative ABC transport system ATP-binding protein